MTATKETFHPNYKTADDAALLQPPAAPPLTELKMFTCSYNAQLQNLCIGFVELSHIIVANLRGATVAFNSNFAHGCVPGYEYLVKRPKPAVVHTAPSRTRPRKVQGDGTCFNSAVGPILSIEHPGVAPDKVYKVRCFPTTGETQIPGVLCADLSDGRAVLRAFVDYLNELKVGTRDARGEPLPVEIIAEQPKMLDYKFRITRSTPRMLINLQALIEYMNLLEATRAVAAAPLTSEQAARFSAWPAIVLPPFPIRETKPPTDDVKVSFRFWEAARAPRVNVFQEGKINILGAASAESADRIYEFFVRLFTENWAALICLRPRSDAERRRVARVAAPPAAPAKAEPLARLAELDAILNSLLGLDDGTPTESIESVELAPVELAPEEPPESEFKGADALAIMASFSDWE
jgi:hypothetical protein